MALSNCVFRTFSNKKSVTFKNSYAVVLLCTMTGGLPTHYEKLGVLHNVNDNKENVDTA